MDHALGIKYREFACRVAAMLRGAPRLIEIAPYISKNAAGANPLKGSIKYQGDLIAPLD